jgi:hypothetical protein
MYHPGTIMDIYKYTIDYSSGGSNPNTKENMGVFENAGILIDGLLLENVSSNYNSAYFSSNTDRLDIQSTYLGTTITNKAKMLDKISYRVYDGAYKDIVLNHTYFSGNSNLKLNSVVFATSDKQYLFDYEDFAFPGAKSRSIDMYGYYNGAGNSNLFPSGYFISNVNIPANRNANSNYSKNGILKKITYPTGGYSLFDWEQNKLGKAEPKTIYPTFEFTTVYSPEQATNNVTTSISTFSLDYDQTVAVKYNFSSTGILTDEFVISTPLVKIYKVNTQELLYSSQLVYSSPASGVPLTLPKGSYRLELQCESAFTSVSCSINYQKQDDGTSVLANGPGLRIKQISAYDSKDSKLLTKDKYNYDDATDLYMKDAINKSTLEYVIGNTASEIASRSYAFYASSRSTLSDFINEPFFYKKVVKTTDTPELSGKSEYEFESGPTDLNVNMISQTDYKNNSPVQKKTYQYDYIKKNNWNCFGVVKTTHLIAGPNVSFYYPFIFTDFDESITTYDIYSMDPFNTYAIVRQYPVLKRETQTVYDNNGLNGVFTSSDYYYGNREQTYPTMIKQLASNGDSIFTEFKYPMDYSKGSLITPDEINNNYNDSIATLVNSYANTSAYLTYVKNQSNAIYSARNTAMNSYATNLTNLISSTTVPWQKAALQMRKDNSVSPVVEKYISVKKKGTTTENLIAAVRNNYSILNSNGVAKTSVESADFTGQVLKSTFVSTPENYYKTKFTFTYNPKFQVTSQVGPDLVPHLYFWGYRGLYPIAEVLNTTYEIASNALNGITPTELSDADSPDMTSVNGLRISLSNAMVNTYTYKPLVGMSSMTDPRGITTYYEYDDFNRLKQTYIIENGYKKILQKYDYHYSK